MLIRCIDFETTGMPEEDGSAVCEVGWCDVHLHLVDASTGLRQPEIRAPWSMLCDPGRPMPPVARSVHHISDQDLAGAKSLAEAIQEMTATPADYYVAHNAKFEQHFFPACPAPWICTWKVALRLWPEAPSHSNQVLRYFLGLEIGDQGLAMPPHRAAPDAYVTAHLFARMVEAGSATIEDMVRWSAGPPLLYRVTFGKHRGSLWSDLPGDYLDWIANKSDMDADTKANARHHLKARAA